MVPSGTKLPSAASLIGMDLNDTSVMLMGVVLRFTRIKDGVRMFMCETWFNSRSHQRELPEQQIDLLDMPIGGWPIAGNAAP